VGTVFLGSEAVARGLLTPKQLRSSAWQRPLRGVYADADLPPGPGLQLRAAAVLMPAHAAFSGRAAAWLLGATSALGHGDPVEVSIPSAARWGPVRGLVVRCVALPAPDVVTHRGGGRCTSPLRTAVDLARSGRAEETVPVLDELLARTGLLVPDVLAAAVPGSGADALDAICWVDTRAESPPESLVRVQLRRRGLVPVPQFVVRDARGGFVARVDLAFPERRVAVEYDGAWHAEPGQFAKDRRRLNALLAAGWRVIHLTAADLRTPDAVVARVAALLAA
jgi:very-short-patch-repair endonuclease